MDTIITRGVSIPRLGFGTFHRQGTVTLDTVIAGLIGKGEAA
jgi:hypothetical protein